MKNWRSETVFGVLITIGLAVGLWQQQRILDRLAALDSSARPLPSQNSPAVVDGATPKPVPSLATVSIDLAVADAPSRGRADAPVVILELSDFQCPFCGRHVRDTYPRLASEFIDRGQVRYVFRHFPLERIHPDAMNAAQAAACAGTQGKFWEMHDRLFANQQGLGLPALLTFGGGLGIDEAKYRSCLTTHETLPVVQADFQSGLKADTNSTPTFFIGRIGGNGLLHATRRISGAQPYSLFESAVSDVLAAKI